MGGGQTTGTGSRGEEETKERDARAQWRRDEHIGGKDAPHKGRSATREAAKPKPITIQSQRRKGKGDVAAEAGKKTDTQIGKKKARYEEYGPDK